MPGGRRANVRLATLPLAFAAAEAAGGDWLTPAEQGRLAAMGSPTRRESFLAAHWSIRCLAADVYGDTPGAWVLEASPTGAPRLLAPQGIPARPWVSLSHCAGWVAVAMAPFPVGVDIERDWKPRDLHGLADATFSPEEREQLRKLPEGERTAAFYLYWTLKEAQGKREGHGLRPELAIPPAYTDVWICTDPRG
ncbi:MAG: 4'-phosphopantetheinyl transferase superfamily protein, partial [Luteimonas sp.]